MEGQIVQLDPKLLVGMHASMSLSEDATPQLWRNFMPRRGEIKHRLDRRHISMSIYGDSQPFQPDTTFQKWAAVAVGSIEQVPVGMDTYHLRGGLYAKFIHHGPAHKFPTTLHFILQEWLPQSPYSLGQGPHFEILPEGYNPMAEDAQEEVWLPLSQE